MATFQNTYIKKNKNQNCAHNKNARSLDKSKQGRSRIGGRDSNWFTENREGVKTLPWHRTPLGYAPDVKVETNHFKFITKSWQNLHSNIPNINKMCLSQMLHVKTKSTRKRSKRCFENKNTLIFKGRNNVS